MSGGLPTACGGRERYVYAFFSSFCAVCYFAVCFSDVVCFCWSFLLVFGFCVLFLYSPAYDSL